MSTLSDAIRRNRERQAALRAEYAADMDRMKWEFDAPGCRSVFLQLPTYSEWLRDKMKREGTGP